MNNREVDPWPSTQQTQPQRSAGGQRKARSSDHKGFEDDTIFHEEDIDNVIRNLGKAKYEITARNDYANELHEMKHPEGRTAFAKIAGNGWTFYVDDLEVRIGRPPDERMPEDQQDGINGDPSLDKSLVHIDLGPSKLVSRQHAWIKFNEENGRWFISINGRNGARLDDLLLSRGQSAELGSGAVIEIAGTQMIFVMPNEAPVVHPSVLLQLRAQPDDNEDDEDDTDLMRPPSLPHRTPTRGGGPRAGPQDRPSSSQRQLSNNFHSRDAFANQAQNVDALAQNGGSAEYERPSSQSGRKTPIYARGFVLGTVDEMDYSADSAKDIKPPHSYAQLIGMAILSDPEEKITLARIYDWMKERYAFYRHSVGGWQVSISFLRL